MSLLVDKLPKARENQSHNLFVYVTRFLRPCPDRLWQFGPEFFGLLAFPFSSDLFAVPLSLFLQLLCSVRVGRFFGRIALVLRLLLREGLRFHPVLFFPFQPGLFLLLGGLAFAKFAA